MFYPLVTVMILNWNGSQDTLDCLYSLEKVNYPRCRVSIWVADNGSTDNSVSDLYPQITLMNQSDWHSVNLLKLSKNYGSPGGFNRIYEKIDKSTDIILRIDNDVIVDPDSLIKVCQRFGQDPDLAVLGIQSFLQRKPDVKCSGAWYFDWKLNTQYQLHPNHLVECDSIVGNFMAIRFNTVQELDYLFDERLFISLDECELCIRTKKILRKKVAFDPAIICYHKSGSSTSKLKGIVVYCHHRNAIFLFKKYAPRNYQFIMGFIVILLRLIKAIFTGDSFKLKGYIDGLRSHFFTEDQLAELITVERNK